MRLWRRRLFGRRRGEQLPAQRRHALALERPVVVEDDDSADATAVATPTRTSASPTRRRRRRCARTGRCGRRRASPVSSGKIPGSSVDLDVQAIGQLAHDVGRRVGVLAAPVPRVLTTGVGNALERVGEDRPRRPSTAASPGVASRLPVPPRHTPTSRMSPSTSAELAEQLPQLVALVLVDERVPVDRVVHHAEVGVVVPRRVRRVHRDDELVGVQRRVRFELGRPDAAAVRADDRSAASSASASRSAGRSPVARASRHARLRAAGDRVQPALVPRDLDVARPKAGPDEHRPQVARVVVRLVVVHLLLRGDTEAEGGELEEALAAP